MSEDEKPFFADGSIVGDYKPLIKYWEILKKRSRKKLDEAFLKREDFEEIRRIVYEKKKVNMIELLTILKNRFKPRIDSDVAVEALKEVYGVSVDPETAVDRIASIMAGWLIEASKNTGIIKYARS